MSEQPPPPLPPSSIPMASPAFARAPSAPPAAGVARIDDNAAAGPSRNAIATAIPKGNVSGNVISANGGNGKSRLRVTRACDQCNYRRVKCHSEAGSTCKPCERSQLECTYLKEPKHRGPKRKRIDSLAASSSSAAPGQDPVLAPAPARASTPSASVAAAGVHLLHQPSPQHPHHRIGQQQHAIPLDRSATPTSHGVPAYNSASSSHLANGGTYAPVHTSSIHHRPILATAPQPLPLAEITPGHDQQSVYDALSLFTGPHNQTVPSFGTNNLAWTDSAMLKFDFNLLSALDFGQDEFRVEDSAFGQLFPDPSGAGSERPSMASRLPTNHSPVPSSSHPASTAFTSVPSAPSPGTLPSASLPPDYRLAHYFSIYFERFHPMFPVVDQQAFLVEIRAQEHRRPGPVAQLVLSIVALVETSERLETSKVDDDPNSAETDSRVGPFLAGARRVSFGPAEDDAVYLYQVISSINIFVAEDILANRKGAWFRLQEAITLAQTLELDRFVQHPNTLDAQDQAAIDGLKVFYVLFICERATAMLQRLPARIHHPLRLPDHAYQSNQHWLSSVPPATFGDFPMPHLRLFSLINSQVLSCWHGNCSIAPSRCTAWSVETALRLQRDLANEFTSALNTYRTSLSTNPPGNVIQNVNLVVTIAWLRDRFWNICHVHGLVQKDAGPELSPTYPFKILRELVDLFDHFKSTDTDPGLDWAAKIHDMAMTAIRSVSQEQLVLTPQSVTTPGSAESAAAQYPLKQQLMPILFKILGLFTMYKHAQDKLLPDLVKALATIT